MQVEAEPTVLSQIIVKMVMAVAALIVLFSAMWAPRVSVAVSVVALAALGVYKLVRKDK